MKTSVTVLFYVASVFESPACCVLQLDPVSASESGKGLSEPFATLVSEFSEVYFHNKVEIIIIMLSINNCELMKITK